MSCLLYKRALSLMASDHRLLQPTYSVLRQQKATSAIFFQKNKKGSDKDPVRLPLSKAVKVAAKRFVPELKLWVHEQKEKIQTNPIMTLEHGNYEVIYRFNDKSFIDGWTVTADRDNNGGKSTANFTLSKNQTGLFYGNLSKEVPQDGVTKYAGYANISSPKPVKSFGRETFMDWSLFNCLLMRVRGDGRPYMIVIGCDFYYDVNWLNRWTFPLFTRGGPYWQLVKLVVDFPEQIPFSKFWVSHHGRIQDKQEYVPLSLVNSFGITVGDAAEGPYCLEIDSVALMYDINLSGKHAYEMYEAKYWEVQS